LLIGGLRTEQDLGDVPRDQVDQPEDQNRDANKDGDDRHHAADGISGQAILNLKAPFIVESRP
jgi:hypothetical protein